MSLNPRDDGELVRRLFKKKVEETRLLRRMPEEIKALFDGLDEIEKVDAHPLQPHPSST